jgi:hypothetical protein
VKTAELLSDVVCHEKCVKWSGVAACVLMRVAGMKILLFIATDKAATSPFTRVSVPEALVEPWALEKLA